MEWGDIIREARQAKGLSQGQLAEMIGVSQPLIAKIEGNKLKKSVHVSKLAEALGLRHDQIAVAIRSEADRLSIDADYLLKPSNRTLTVPEFVLDPAYWASAAGLDGDIPLYASAQGGEGSLLIEKDAISTVSRPAMLQGVKSGYAIYLTGESMVPEFEPGDILIINPRLPIIANVSCVFYSMTENEPVATVKRYLSQTETEWRVRQYNPQKDFTLQRSEWPITHRIVAKNFR